MEKFVVSQWELSLVSREIDALEAVQTSEVLFGDLEIVFQTWPVFDLHEDFLGRGALGPLRMQHRRNQILQITTIGVVDWEVIWTVICGKLEICKILCMVRHWEIGSLNDGANVVHDGP